MHFPVFHFSLGNHPEVLSQDFSQSIRQIALNFFQNISKKSSRKLIQRLRHTGLNFQEFIQRFQVLVVLCQPLPQRLLSPAEMAHIGSVSAEWAESQASVPVSLNADSITKGRVRKKSNYGWPDNEVTKIAKLTRQTDVNSLSGLSFLTKLAVIRVLPAMYQRIFPLNPVPAFRDSARRPYCGCRAAQFSW
jgi:hypothetical protein